ncbi:hypothetical protein SDC9_158708 [bioreactor metagenome]|uniref:Uncharacterized protein n=1 Tax=bioreactor metagenome TaxID=1076179 RepID=A0A645FAX4_9ZZZZ
MPVEIHPLLGVTNLELPEQGLLVDSDTHRREFHGILANCIPYDDVSVQAGMLFIALGRPVVVVGSPSSMTDTIGQRRTDANQENCSVFFSQNFLALLRGKLGILLLCVFGMDEGNLVGKRRGAGGEHLTDEEFCSLHC